MEKGLIEAESLPTGGSTVEIRTVFTKEYMGKNKIVSTIQYKVI